MKKCPNCGGVLVLIDKHTETYLCDVCWYEISLDGIVNEGECKEDDK